MTEQRITPAEVRERIEADYAEIYGLLQRVWSSLVGMAIDRLARLRRNALDAAAQMEADAAERDALAAKARLLEAFALEVETLLVGSAPDDVLQQRQQSEFWLVSGLSRLGAMARTLRGSDGSQAFVVIPRHQAEQYARLWFAPDQEQVAIERETAQRGLALAWRYLLETSVQEVPRSEKPADGQQGPGTGEPDPTR